MSASSSSSKPARAASSWISASSNLSCAMSTSARRQWTSGSRLASAGRSSASASPMSVLAGVDLRQVHPRLHIARQVSHARRYQSAARSGVRYGRELSPEHAELKADPRQRKRRNGVVASQMPADRQRPLRQSARDRPARRRAAPDLRAARSPRRCGDGQRAPLRARPHMPDRSPASGARWPRRGRPAARPARGGLGPSAKRCAVEATSACTSAAR